MLTEGITDASPKGIRDLGGTIQSSLRNHKGGNVMAICGSHPERAVDYLKQVDVPCTKT
jgi:hypothetical protein